MRISLSWLQNYVTINLPPEELSERLTMAGLEVENIDRLGAKYDRFVVGEVLEVTKHPKADKLTLCRVNVGEESLLIVCGAPNVRPGQKVPVGLLGATVPRNQHDPEGKPFVLSQVKIRGADSFGMICSPYELSLGEDAAGIMILDAPAKPGTALAEYLGLDDTVFEVGITPNRPDAMSHIGIAREVASFLKTAVRLPEVHLKESPPKALSAASVTILDTHHCPRYTAKVILNVTVGPSPEWMQALLTAVGLRPVNNIVDVTNYVLMECGHPLHAFDYDTLEGHSIIVRSAREGEGFTTLDHKTRTLAADTLMICDRVHPVAVAGVMGGENTEITGSTRNILLESAYFEPRSIRRTSKRFGLSTDASQRFERGTDPNITEWAANRAAGLIQEVAGGEVLSGSIDIYPEKILEKEIELDVQRANRLLGLDLPAEEITDLLERLSIKALPGTNLRFRIPTFRPDIEREVDLIEEIARAHGYDKIGISMRAGITFLENQPPEDLTDELSAAAVGMGYREVVANSMQEFAVASLFSEKAVRIANPISKDMGALRTSMLPGMLTIVRDNIFHGTKNLRLFECGKVYFLDPGSTRRKLVGDYVEEERLILVVSGMANPPSWDQKHRFVDIFDAKGEIQILAEKIFLDNIKFIPYPNTKALNEHGLLVEIHDECAGWLGAVRREILDTFEIEQDVFIAELLVDVLRKNRRKEKKFKELSKYPSVRRDIAVIVSEGIPALDLESEIRQAGESLLVGLELFDVYRGSQIGQGNKSCAFALEFRSADHTLAQQEIDQVMQNISDRLAERFNATIRKQEESPK
jgi:phenylalanyl-tRNA synthetase beta chain